MTAPTILNLLVDLSKRIHLRPGLASEASELTQFLVPSDPSLPYQFFAGRLTWWAADDYLRRVDGFVSYVIEHEPDLAGGDTESFQKTFLDTLQQHAFDAALFNPAVLQGASVGTLFEARSEPDVQVWRERLWDVIRASLRDSIRSWLVIYPLHSVTGKAFDLGYDGIAILGSDDKARWQALAARYTMLRDWSPRVGLRGHEDDLRWYGGPSNRWLACEVTGTAAGATTIAAERMWTLVALLLAHFYSVSKSVLVRLQAQTPFMCGQFSTDTVTERGMYTQRQIGPLLPHQANDLNVNDALITDLRKWYAAREATDEGGRRRATVASHFALYGINADLVEERYIHFFIALDALFGDRGRVELGIRDGLISLRGGGAESIAQIADLYTLRNDLVHGGASRIATWNGLERYERRFKSKPLQDVSDAAMDGIKRFFAIRAVPPARRLSTRIHELQLDIARAWRRFRSA